MVRRTPKGRRLTYHRSLRRSKSFRGFGGVFKVGFFGRLFLPTSVDLRPVDSPIQDQGQEGSCTSFASCGLANFLEIKKGLSANPLANPQEYIKGQFVSASEAFVYWVERAFLGTANQDSGAYLHTGAQVFTEKGACSSADYPYGPQTLFGEPAPALWGKAYNHKVSQALNIADGDVASVQASLADGYPVMFGMPVYQDFEELTAENYVLPMPSPFESELGGHANVWVGYNSQGFIGRNSWGTSWGNSGYYIMPYEYMTQYCSDLWTFR